MSTEQLDQILKDTIERLYYVFGGAILLMLICAVTALLRYRAIKKKPPQSKKKNVQKKWIRKIRELRILTIVGFCFIPVLLMVGAGKIYPAQLDLLAQRYVQAETTYYRSGNPRSRFSWLNDGYVTVTLNGQRETLALHFGWTEEEFPEGKLEGTIWYSRESEILLAFVPKEGT